jgi:hypothetical protein
MPCDHHPLHLGAPDVSGSNSDPTRRARATCRAWAERGVAEEVEEVVMALRAAALPGDDLRGHRR